MSTEAAAKVTTATVMDENNPLKQCVSSMCEKRPLSSPATPDTHSKKTRMSDNDNDTHEQYDEEQIPSYLQTTNKTFRQFLLNNKLALMEHDIQQLAILRHKMVMVNFDKTLWNIYFKSSTGQWQTGENHKVKNVHNRRLWPVEVKKMLASKLNKPMIDVNEATTEDQQMYEHLIQEHLQKIDRTLEKYQHEYQERKRQEKLINLTNQIDQAIELFIQQQPTIRCLQVKLNFKILLLQYAYDIQLLEYQYMQLQPTEKQVRSDTIP